MGVLKPAAGKINYIEKPIDNRMIKIIIEDIPYYFGHTTDTSQHSYLKKIQLII